MADKQQNKAANRDETVINRDASERTAIVNNAPANGAQNGDIDLSLHDYQEINVNHEDSGDGYVILEGVSFNALHGVHVADEGSPARVELRPWNGGTDTQIVIAGATTTGKSGSTTVRYYIPPK